ncbi:MAG: hypothetical protein ACREPR_04825 [Brasilonema sp.]
MSTFEFSFSFLEKSNKDFSGKLFLDEILPWEIQSKDYCYYRTGRVVLNDGRQVELVLGHSPWITEFFYFKKTLIDSHFLKLFGLNLRDDREKIQIDIPSQLIFGAKRTEVIGEAVNDIVQNPVLKETLKELSQDEIITIPILREGIKYQVNEALYSSYNYLCDEIVTDPHHVFDDSIPDYGRRVVMNIFKDKDLTQEQRDNIKTAFISDSISSGIILFGLLDKIVERYHNLKQVEIIAPFASLRGLARIASLWKYKFSIRVHLFEAVLNSLPPEYYYTAHFSNPELHFDPQLETKYQEWWGRDKDGNLIAETACAGYGWSEAFFNPRKQVAMMNQQLQMRNGLTISEILKKNIDNIDEALLKL